MRKEGSLNLTAKKSTSPCSKRPFWEFFLLCALKLLLFSPFISWKRVAIVTLWQSLRKSTMSSSIRYLFTPAHLGKEFMPLIYYQGKLWDLIEKWLNVWTIIMSSFLPELLYLYHISRISFLAKKWPLETGSNCGRGFGKRPQNGACTECCTR